MLTGNMKILFKMQSFNLQLNTWLKDLTESDRSFCSLD